LGGMSLRHGQRHEHPWQTPSLWGQPGFPIYLLYLLFWSRLHPI